MQYVKNEIFYFERGAYFSGSLEYKIELIEGKYILKGQAYNGFCWMDAMKFEIPAEEIVRLEKLLKPVAKWKQEYETQDEIYDGYGWDIYFKYGGMLIETSGYEKYPRNYDRIVSVLQKFIERLGIKYNEKYQREGRKERIKL